MEISLELLVSEYWGFCERRINRLLDSMVFKYAPGASFNPRHCQFALLDVFEQLMVTVTPAVLVFACIWLGCKVSWVHNG